MRRPESPTVTDPQPAPAAAGSLPPDAHAGLHRARAARAAGAAYLVYIAAGVAGMRLAGDATRGAGTAERLARVAQHAGALRLAVVLGLLGAACALVLAVALYRLTRDQDPDLARLACACRVAEGIIGALGAVPTMGLVWLATGAAGAGAGTAPLGAFLLHVGAWSGPVSATLFALGSTLFSYLLLRARTIPVPLAWLGVVASGPLVVALPAQLVGVLAGPVTGLIWLPMLAFEVPLGLWLLIRGVPAPARRA